MQNFNEGEKCENKFSLTILCINITVFRFDLDSLAYSMATGWDQKEKPSVVPVTVSLTWPIKQTSNGLPRFLILILSSPNSNSIGICRPSLLLTGKNKIKNKIKKRKKKKEGHFFLMFSFYEGHFSQVCGPHIYRAHILVRGPLYKTGTHDTILISLLLGLEFPKSIMINVRGNCPSTQGHDSYKRPQDKYMGLTCRGPPRPTTN